MYLHYFGQNLESKKKVTGIMAHVCMYPLNFCAKYADTNSCIVHKRAYSFANAAILAIFLLY